MATNTITVRAASDFHSHLRQDAIMRMVVPRIMEGGVSLAYVMVRRFFMPTIALLIYQRVLSRPSFILPAKPAAQSQTTHHHHGASSYLQSTVGKAGSQGHISHDLVPVAGTDSRGSAPGETGWNRSDSGIESYEIYYPVFKAMEEEGLVLNLHGEVPSDDEKFRTIRVDDDYCVCKWRAQDICFMNAEEKFLPHLAQLHADFPSLKIVLEHATSKAAVEMVKSLGDTVACTITIHHLQLIADDWAGQAHHFCKPVAKYPHDRLALREIVAQGR
ncbi:hypothetical protein BC937DRAFT_89203 [Endogone sp. FLAS-F59071]|nr:hypothetical protein BC937DRAFT_89203 [Endogone sp. FLAS-F59071]|eukprot:RUS18041.1 hypothetical protein BC937DRAFT_89203 [Endogone sp. FLAS-F59071]